MDLSLNYGQSALSDGESGGNWWDFGYQLDNAPPSGAATTATQVESGGSGLNFDINQGLKDLAAIFIARETVQAQQAAAPVQYRRAENGQLYVTDPAYRQQGVAGVPMGWIMIGAAALLAFAMVKD